MPEQKTSDQSNLERRLGIATSGTLLALNAIVVVIVVLDRSSPSAHKAIMAVIDKIDTLWMQVFSG